MNYATLFHYVNQMNIEEFVSLSVIRNEKQKRRYISLGYESVFTVGEWEKNFTKLESKYIFFTNHIVSKIFYFEKEKYLLIEIPFIYTLPQHTLLQPQFYDPEKLQNSVLEQIQLGHECYEKKDWRTLLMRMKSSLRLDILRDLVTKEQPSGEIYSAFLMAYSSAEYGFSKVNRFMLDRVFAGKTEEQKKKTLESLEELPDTVTVYRGETDKSRPYTEAISWTLDFKVASFFAKRFPSTAARIIEAEVSKSDIMERFEREREVLIDPIAIKVIRITNL